MSALSPTIKTEIPGPRSKALIAEGAFDMQSIYRALVIDDVASSGPYMVDADGNVILDMFANFALGALGYNHPALVEVAKSDAYVRASVNPTSTPFVTTPAWFDLMHRIQKHAPPGMGKIYFVDAGGEGVEAALKVAFIRHGEKRREKDGGPRNPLELPANVQDQIMQNAGTDAVLISFSGAFHGRGLGPLSATHSKVIHKADLPAFPWPMVEFPVNRWPLEKFADENAKAEAESLKALERAIDAHAGRVAAIVVEPIQSEGGDRHASPAFFRGVQALAKKAGAMLVLDEVQTGVAATGKMWCHEHFELPEPPDLVAFGKKMQLGGFFARDEHAITQFGRMYQTRNGDRARVMLSATVLETIAKEKLVERAASLGKYFLEGLNGLAAKFPKLVTEPRGRGLLMSFDMPTTAARDDLLKRAMKRGVMATYTGTRSVRLRPHLVTTEREADIAVSVLGDALAEMG